MTHPRAWIDTRSQERGDVIEAIDTAVAEVAFTVVILLALAAAAVPLALLIRHCRHGAWNLVPPRGVDRAGPGSTDTPPNATADDLRLCRMLAEARAQYDVWPSDYLEGVVSALHETVYDTPFVVGRREHDQVAHAAGRSPHGRVRDYYLGRTTTLAWILGDQPEPPVQPVLTEPAPPPHLPPDAA